MPPSKFFEQIKKFNAMYKMESNDTPTDLGRKRLLDFKSILLEEIEEVDEIIANGKDWDGDIKVSLSDWLGDIIVYCASECRRWGLPTEEILSIIMESNFSKMGPDGKPIYDERGKLLKGPNYWKPETKIKEILSESLEILKKE